MAIIRDLCVFALRSELKRKFSVKSDGMVARLVIVAGAILKVVTFGTSIQLNVVSNALKCIKNDIFSL